MQDQRPDTIAMGSGGAAPHRLAVFDFDNTIINGQTGVIFTRYLLDRGYISRWNVIRVIGWGAKYFIRLPVEQCRVREYFFKDELKGVSESDFRAIARDFHDKVLCRQYRSDALATITQRRREGCVTLLASATFQEVADEAARHLAMDGAVGTTMARDAQGHFTGQVRGEVAEGRNKLRAIQQWADDHLGAGRWRFVYAYGDHYSDFYMLSAAAHPVAVHPSVSLWARAVRHGWPIKLWR